MQHIAKLLLAVCLGAFAQTSGASYEHASKAYAAKDFARALELARPLAESGHADAQYLVAVLYRHGRGVARDDVVAASWLAKAVEGSNANAMNDLGSIYRKGEGVAKDDSRAFTLFNRAAEANSSAAQLNLAKMYEDGIATTRDPLAARYWYERADATRFERSLQQKGILQPHTSPSGKVLSEGCRPKAPPVEAMNQKRVDMLTGNIDVFVDREGKIRGLREDALSNADLKFEVVAVFSEALRGETCRFDADVRETSVRIPFTFKLE
jgi:Sel1 repeat